MSRTYYKGEYFRAHKGSSNKWWKQHSNRKFRRIIKESLKQEIESPYNIKEVSDIYDSHCCCQIHIGWTWWWVDYYDSEKHLRSK